MNHTNSLETRVLPSFIEASAPLVTNPWMRPRPTHGRNLLELFEKDSSCESVNNTSLFKVYLRLKPVNEDVSDIYKVTSDTSLLTTSDHFKGKSKLNKMYNFSRIFRPDCVQREIFDVVVRDNILDLYENKSFTLLTYGSSGSGKTYTLMGTEEEPGLIPRTLEYMFQSLSPLRHPNFKTKDGSDVEKLNMTQKIDEMKFSKSITQKLLKGMKTYRRMSERLSSDFQNESYLQGTERHSIWVSFCEIYNETINDLLVTKDKAKSANTLKLCEDTKGHCYVKGLSQVFVRSSKEAYNVMVHGQRNLRYAETGIHSQSSRSHCLYTITLITHFNGRHVVSLLRLCDLAGSERAQQTHNTGERMKESRSINSSLAVLERCLVMLKNKQKASMSTTSSDNTIAGAAGTKSFVMPLRESKLTRLLGSSLTGGGSVTMLVAVNPERAYFSESQHVLKLSAIANQLWVEPSTEISSYQDSTTDSFAQIQKECEIERLKFELARATKDLVVYKERETDMQAQFRIDMEDVVKEAQKVTAWKYEQRLQQQKDKYQDQLEEKDEIIKNLTESEAMMKIDMEELENTLDRRDQELEYWRNAFAALEITHEEMRAHYEIETEETERESVMIVEEPTGNNVVWLVDSEDDESENSQYEEDSGDEEETGDEAEDDQQKARNTSLVAGKSSDLFDDSMIQLDPENDMEAITENKEKECVSSDIHVYDTGFEQTESDQDEMTNADNSSHEEEKINWQTIENVSIKLHNNNKEIEFESKIISNVIEKADASSDSEDVNEHLGIEAAAEYQVLNNEEASISAEDNKIEIVETEVVENGERNEKVSEPCSDESRRALKEVDTNVDNSQPVAIERLNVSEINNEENMVSIKTPNSKAAAVLEPETSSKKSRRKLWTRRVEEEVENTDNEDESPAEKLVNKPKVPMFYGSRGRRRKNEKNLCLNRKIPK